MQKEVPVSNTFEALISNEDHDNDKEKGIDKSAEKLKSPKESTKDQVNKSFRIIDFTKVVDMEHRKKGKDHSQETEKEEKRNEIQQVVPMN